jgi:TRAP-type C4-dicarboxylate transport system permease small subunit
LHINISLVDRDRLPKAVNLFLDKLADLVVLVVGLVLLRYGTTLVGFTMRSIMPATGWPSGVMYAIVPFAAVFIIWDGITALLGIDTRDEEVNRYLGGEGTLRDVIGDHHA